MKKNVLTLLVAFCTCLPISAEELCNYVENESSLGINMVYVEGGTFLMGTNKDKYREFDEENVHLVKLDDFYIGKTEITIAQFAKFVEETNYKTDAEIKGRSYIWDDEKALMVEKENVNWRCNELGELINENDYSYYPVVYISWQDATAFCNWLSEKTGKKYSLPTEAQWEYAAKGGKLTKGYLYSGSNDLNEVRCASLPCSSNCVANELGLFDMSGGVSEWCRDSYAEYEPFYCVDPCVKYGEDCVVRGGSYLSYDETSRFNERVDVYFCEEDFRMCETTSRMRAPKDRVSKTIGCRLVINL